jgi:hypothetical protein
MWRGRGGFPGRRLVVFHRRGGPGVVVAPIGAGQVVLLGFCVQHRALGHGTCELLFNALVTGPAASR